MNKTDLVLLVAVLVVALALGATIFFIVQAREERVVQSSKEIIEEIDSQLERGYMNQARDTMERLARSDVSAATYLMLLKRADILRKQTESWELFLEIARRGHEGYPGRTDLYALYIYALLRSDQQDRAVKLAAERSVEGERWADLREELSLYLKREDAGEKRAEGAKQELYQSLQSESPELFFRLYRTTGNSGFLLDAALLAARNGSLPRAWEMLQNEPHLLRNHPQLAFFLALDAGRPEQARQLLDRFPGEFPEDERLLLHADLAFRLGETSAAEELCKRIIREHPEVSWIPYHNAVYTSLERGAMPADELLLPNEEFGGSRGEYLLNVAQLLIAYDRPDEAQRVLRSDETIADDATEYQLVMERTRETVNPERYKALLRMMVNRDGGQKYAMHLAWFYLGIEDYKGLAELLDYYRQRYGETPWLSFYEGVLAYERGRYPEAAGHFRESSTARQIWESAYNAALANARAGEINAALSLLEEARLLCGETSECDTIHFAKADIHLRHGDYEKARGELKKGFAIDEHDIDGRLLEEILKERTE